MAHRHRPEGAAETVRTLVLNEMHDLITGHDANESWVREATSDERCSDEAIQTALTHRFGERRVIYDPSDPEANKLAVSKGYTVVTCSQLNGVERANVKRAGAMLPAGQVTPGPKAFTTDPNAPVCKMLRREDWTDGMKTIAAYAELLADELMRVSLEVAIADSKGMKARAAYSVDLLVQAHLILNLAYLGTTWFEQGVAQARANARQKRTKRAGAFLPDRAHPDTP